MYRNIALLLRQLKQQEVRLPILIRDLRKGKSPELDEVDESTNNGQSKLKLGGNDKRRTRIFDRLGQQPRSTIHGGGKDHQDDREDLGPIDLDKEKLLDRLEPLEKWQARKRKGSILKN